MHTSQTQHAQPMHTQSRRARVWLRPRAATDANVAQFESRRKQHEAVADRERRAAEVVAKKLEADSLTAQVKVGEEDRLFGSVTVHNIAQLLEEKGYEIDRRAIHLDDGIRELDRSLGLGAGHNSPIIDSRRHDYRRL